MMTLDEYEGYWHRHLPEGLKPGDMIVYNGNLICCNILYGNNCVRVHDFGLEPLTGAGPYSRDGNHYRDPLFQDDP